MSAYLRKMAIDRYAAKPDLLALFCKEILVAPRRISQVHIHLLCLLFSVSHVSKRHFPNWKSAATAALSAKKQNGRTEVNGGAALLFSGAGTPPLTPPEGAVCP